MKKIILAALFLAVLSISNYSQYYSKEIREILTLQDTRTLGENNKLLDYLNSSDSEIVVKALIALANIADTSAIDRIGELLLSRKETHIRTNATFALGQISSPRSAEYLARSMDTETDAEVLSSVLDALGRVGDETALSKVIAHQTDNETVKKAQVISIIRFGLRKIKNPEAIKKLQEQLTKLSYNKPVTKEK